MSTSSPAAGLPAAVWTVAAFQLGRLLTWQRLVMAALLAVFPAAVLLAATRAGRGALASDVAVAMLYALVPEAVCMLGLLLTMCPAVSDELERGTWAHVATRPRGRRALLVGTWLAAVLWTAAVALVGLALALAVTDVARPGRVFGLFAALTLLSCAGRGALFALPAVVLPKRALAASVGAAIVVEFLAGTIPAVVNQATVSLRLRSLLVDWMGWKGRLPVEMQLFVDPRPAWVHVLAVTVLVAVLLGTAVFILERRQFPPSDEV